MQRRLNSDTVSPVHFSYRHFPASPTTFKSIGALRQAKHAPAQLRIRRGTSGSPPLPSAMVWNHHDPRAVCPHKDLLTMEKPVVGTTNHALSSPLPYGIGIYAGKCKEVKQVLPLHFVSEPAAESLGPDVEPGWYACGTPGDSLEVRITVVQSPFHSIHGKKVSNGRAVAARIMVDGRTSNKGYYWFHKNSCLGDECTIPGFVEFPNHEPGRSFGKHVMRPFTFGKVPSAVGAPSNEAAARPSTRSIAGAGNRDIAKMYIFTEVYMGLLRRCVFNKSWSRKMRKVRKEGKTQSSCGGPNAKCAGLETYVERLETNGFIHVFICERSWLLSHNIIDIHGNGKVNSGGTDSRADATVDMVVSGNTSVDTTAGKRSNLPYVEGQTKKAKIVEKEPVLEMNEDERTLVKEALIPEMNEASISQVKKEILVETNASSMTQLQNELLPETNEHINTHLKEPLPEKNEPCTTNVKKEPLLETYEPSNTQVKEELLMETNEPNNPQVKEELHLERNEGE